MLRLRRLASCPAGGLQSNLLRQLHHRIWHLSAIGNSLGIVIEKPILELLNITRDTELEVTTDGSRLIIEPVRAEKKEGRHGRVGAATKRVMKNHDRTPRRLAE